MRKIINNPDDFVDEVIESVLLAYPSRIRAVSADRRALARVSAPSKGKVGIVTGGGSGHLPLFLGYLGEGLCSGVAVGNVFSSPSADQILEATKASDSGSGVLYLYGNYGGDVFNFDLAADLADLSGIRTTTVIFSDDVASATADNAGSRRGVAGMVLAFKIAGAAAERGMSLEDVARIARSVNARTRSMGVGLAPTVLPAVGVPTFELDDGQMEIGIGIHGERGIHRGPLESASAIARRLINAILTDLQLDPGARVALLVNGLGATPLEELHLLHLDARHILDEAGIQVERVLIGEYATSLEMAGASITLLHLDEELLGLLDEPADSPLLSLFRSGASDELN